MNRLLKYIQFSCLSFMLIGTSCIRDGLDECPPVDPGKYSSYIRLIYDYNMSFEDLFHRQVSNYDLYLFDDDGVFLHRMVETCPAGTTFPKGYTVGVLKEFEAATQFVVFAGVDASQENLPAMTPGTSTLNDLYLKLNERKDNIVENRIPPLWHGQNTNKNTTSPNDTTVISLVKNTNTVRIVLQSLDDSKQVDIADFSFNIKSVNGSYDAYNNTIDSNSWNYHPYVLENRGDEGAVAEMSVLRLLSERENRLTIENKASGTSVIDVNLNKYLSALKLSEYEEMSFSEYLDREDVYSIIVFLLPVECPSAGEDDTWIASSISINNWVQREQGGDL